MTQLILEQALNGLQFGLMLFLLAAGLTLVFGIMDCINLAHGSLYMVGAYFVAAAAQAADSFWLGLGAILALMTLVWLLSLVRRDASIVDVFWGPGFVLAAWIYAASGETRAPRGVLTAVLATLWGLRLALHILWRSRGRGEDYRYRAMRERDPAGFPRRSLLTVFWLQGVLLWVISAPLFQAQRPVR